MRVIAIVDLPDGTRAGGVLETTPEIGRALVLVGVAREAATLPAEPTPAAKYKRRDLKAEG